MRQNVDVRALADSHRLQCFQRQIIPALDGAVVDVDDDMLVHTGSLKLLVHDFGSAFDIGDAGRSAALGQASKV